ncbi:MAG: hypothetical protein ACOCTM_04420 [Bacteroidota bacterium]
MPNRYRQPVSLVLQGYRCRQDAERILQHHIGICEEAEALAEKAIPGGFHP